MMVYVTFRQSTRMGSLQMEEGASDAVGRRAHYKTRGKVRRSDSAAARRRLQEREARRDRR